MRGAWFRNSDRRRWLMDLGALVAATGGAIVALRAFYQLFRGLFTGVVAPAPSRRRSSRRKGPVRREDDALGYSVELVGWTIYGTLFACATLILGFLYQRERANRPGARAERLELDRAPLDAAIFEQLGKLAPEHWNAVRLYVRWQAQSLLYYQLLSPEGHQDNVTIPEAVHATGAQLQRLFNREWMIFESLSYELTRAVDGSWHKQLDQQGVQDTRR
ncbi:MAG TPA: hypothetical protein VHO25_19945 [Polyangiaceae bacterium]|nr:hypothetical protein [Polyangiaceae bacterium]